MTRRSVLPLGACGLALACLCAAGSAAAQTVQVTAANPNAGAQGTTSLVVKISGKNFAPGAKTDFFLSGTNNPDGIVVHGTQWISATEVDATIDIADTASLALFDIKVTNTSGRSGKGSDLFQVIQKTQQVQSCTKQDTCPVTSLSVQIVDTDANGVAYPIRSDGQGLYYDGQENVTASFPSGGGFIFDTGMVFPATRNMVAEFNNPLQGSSPYSLLLNAGAHYHWQIFDTDTIGIQELAVGGSMCKSGALKPDDGSEYYAALYNCGVETGSTSITGRWLITRVGPTTWTIETSPTCKGYNVTDGDIVNLRHQVVVTPKNGRPQTQWVTVGYYHLSFKMILTAQ